MRVANSLAEALGPLRTFAPQEAVFILTMPALIRQDAARNEGSWHELSLTLPEASELPGGFA